MVQLCATTSVVEDTAFVKLEYHFVSFDCDGNWACGNSYFQGIFIIFWNVFVPSDRRLLGASRVASAVILPCVWVCLSEQIPPFFRMNSNALSMSPPSHPLSVESQSTRFCSERYEFSGSNLCTSLDRSCSSEKTSSYRTDLGFLTSVTAPFLDPVNRVWSAR